MNKPSGSSGGRSYNRPLQVVGFIASRRGDEERGPLVRMRSDDARTRLVNEGELVWVVGPRGKALAPLVFDETLPRGGVVVRDLPSLLAADIVRVLKVDLDRPPLPPSFV